MRSEARLTTSERQKSVRSTNIQAGKGKPYLAVADAIRTSLGPRGMDKMIKDSKGGVTITNDGATILNQMELIHPTAKMVKSYLAGRAVKSPGY